MRQGWYIGIVNVTPKLYKIELARQKQSQPQLGNFDNDWGQEQAED